MITYVLEYCIEGEKGEKRGDAVAVDHSQRLIMETGKGESAMKMQSLKEEEEGENIKSGNNTTSNGDTSEFLMELNLVMILSFLSLSAEEKLDFQTIKPKDLIKHTNPKGSDATLHAYKHESKVNEFRALERQTHKFQTKIRDCRYDFRGSWLGTKTTTI